MSSSANVDKSRRRSAREDVNPDSTESPPKLKERTRESDRDRERASRRLSAVTRPSGERPSGNSSRPSTSRDRERERERRSGYGSTTGPSQDRENRDRERERWQRRSIAGTSVDLIL